MMQGDSYLIGMRILNNAGSAVTPADIEDVQITVGHLCKTYRKAQLTFSEGMWLFPISQKESFSCRTAAPKAQVRVKWKGGTVEGKPVYGLRVQESICKEVL